VSLFETKVWDKRRAIQKPVAEYKEMDEFVSSMITDSGSRLLVCTSGEGTLTAFNTRAKKMEGQVDKNKNYTFSADM
jgi:hypothetical protein